MSGHDEELVALAMSGEADALATLLEQHGPGVRRRLAISPVWQSVLDAADVMQVTYLEAYLRIDRLANRTVSGFVAWLTQIAHNNLRDAVRALERQRRPDPRRRHSVGSGTDSYIGLLEAVGFTSHTPSRDAAACEARELLEAAIAELPETYQRVVRLCDLEERSVKEVAHRLGRSPGSVHMLRARAHDRLRELLGSTSRFFSDRA